MTKKIDRPLDDEDGMAYGGAAYADVPKIRDIPTGDNEAYFRRLINYSFAVNQLYNPKVHDNRPDPFRPTYSPIPYGRAEGGRVLEDDFPSHYLPGVGRQVMQDGGTAADIEASIRAAQDIASRKGMEHERGVSGVVEFAPVNIREPLTGYSAQVATLPKDTARVVEPALQTAADVGPYFTPAAPIAAARDVAVGLREGDPEAVAMSAFGLPGKTAKALAVGASALMPDEAQAGIVNKALNAIRAYHGSPHKFDKFDISKIGTGEGAQAYGHGLYFAEHEPVAWGYKHSTSGRQATHAFDDVPIEGNQDYFKIEDKLKDEGNWRQAKALREYINSIEPDIGLRFNQMKEWHRTDPEMVRAIDALSGRIKTNVSPGHMYEVDIHADPSHMLDWDKPLSEQSHVFKKLQNIGAITPEGELTFMYNETPRRGGEMYERLTSPLAQKISGGANQSSASNTLREAGIPGIKYLDQGSRGAGEGTSNYVVFDPNIIEILRRYMSGGRVGMADGGDPNAAETSQPGLIDQALKVASYFNPVGTAQAGPINKALDVVRRVNPIGMHSPSAAAVEAAMKQEKGPASQMIGSLKNLPGVKPEELHWSGIHSAFDPGETVTRQQIMDYLHSNLPKVEETVLGSPDESKLNAADAAVRAAIRAHNEAQATPRYYAHNPDRSYASSFFPTREEAEAHATTLPEAYHAGMNIVEHQGNPLDVYETMRRLHAGEYPTNLPASVTRPALSLIDERSALEKAAEGSATKFGEYTIPGGQNYREVLLHTPGQKQDLYKQISQAREDRIAAVKEHGSVLKYDDPALEQERLQKIREATKRENDLRAKLENIAPEFTSAHWDQPNVLGHLRMSDRTGPEGEKVLHLEELQSDWGQAGRKKGFALGPGKLPEGYTVQEIPKRQYEGGPQTGVEYAVFDPTKTQVGLYAPTREEAINSAIGGKFGVPTAPYVSSPEGKHTSSWVDLGLKRALKEAAEGGYNKLVWTPGEEQAARYDLSKQINSVFYDPESSRLVANGSNGRVIDKVVPKNELSDVIGKEATEKLLNTETKDFGGLESGTKFHSLTGQDLKIGGEGMKGFYDKILPTQLQKIIKKLDPKAKIEMSAHDLPAGHGEEGVKGHVLHITPELREAIMKGLPAFAEGGEVNKAGGGSVSKIVEDALLALHNMKSHRMDMVERLGGLPVPSIAIAKPEHGFKSFGDITLVGGKEMATPSRLNPVYGSDVYSPRFPHIDEDTGQIFRGYTASGNRRYAPVTMENVIREMKGNIRGGENYNYGAGNVRASVTPQFRTLKDVQGARGNIISGEEFQPHKEAANAELFELADKFHPYSKYSNSSFGHAGSFAETLSDIGKGRHSAWKQDYENLPDDLKSEAMQYLDRLRKMPTEYFEAKPQRAVELGEFSGAVVPESIMKDVEPRLKNLGVKEVVPFNPQDEGSQQKALLEFSKLHFQDGGSVINDALDVVSNLPKNRKRGRP